MKKKRVKVRKESKYYLKTQKTTMAMTMITDNDAIEINAVRGKSVGVVGV